MIPPTTLGSRARPGSSWDVGPSSAGLLGVFLLALGLWLTFGSAPEGMRAEGPVVLAAGIGCLLFMMYLGTRRRPITRREMLSDISTSLPVDLGGEDRNPQDSDLLSEKLRKL